MRGQFAATLFLFLAASHGAAQDAIRLVEQFPPDYQYRVNCRVALEGSLKLPAGKDQAARNFKITGKSAIEYHERVLSLARGHVDKTVRKVQRMEFTRTVNGQDQESKLRPEVDLLVIQRLQSLEVPFSPQGPLLVGEIDLVRTDVFTPALAGLLPKTPVRSGETWSADVEAVKELTDLETIKKGDLTCRLEGLEGDNQRLARVSFKGTINGIGEDGPAEHELDGYYFFDLQRHQLSYVSLQGIHRPLNGDGQPQGEVKGSFTLTRDPAVNADMLSNQALARYNLTPNDDNTQLLFDNGEARFLYPRHWRVDETKDRQLRLIERQGSDLLITVDPPAKQAVTAQFQREALAGLMQQKAQITKVQNVRTLQANPFPIEHFGYEARFGAQPAVFDYYVVRQARGGATLSLRSPPAQATERRRDVERIARSMGLEVK